MQKRFSNVIGFDDAPFPSGHTGKVKVAETVYAQSQLNGILTGDVKRDGTNAARKLTQLVSQSRFAQTIQLIMLQKITLAGF
jgi:endonuclease V-like protein UPF0215 family